MIDLTGRRRIASYDRTENLLIIRPGKRRLKTEQLVHGRAQRVDIGTVINANPLGHGLLRAYVP